MNKKTTTHKLLALLLTLVMTLGMLPMTAFAAGYTAGDINGTTGTGTAIDPVSVDNFTEMKAALQHEDIENVSVDGWTNTTSLDYYVLEGGVDYNNNGAAIRIKGNKTLILNANVACAAKSMVDILHCFISVSSPAELTITGSGKISCGFMGVTDMSNAVVDVQAMGKLNVSGNISIEANQMLSGGQTYGTAIWIDNDSVVNISSSGTFTGDNTKFVGHETMEMGSAVQNVGGILNISNGKFTSITQNYQPTFALRSGINATTTIAGGEFAGIKADKEGDTLSSLLASGCNYYKVDNSVFDGSSINTTMEKLTVKNPSKHTVSVENGYASLAQAANGEMVTITANPPATGKQFKNWTVSGGGIILADATKSTTTFTMGSADVSVKANYETVQILSSINVTVTAPTAGATAGNCKPTTSTSGVNIGETYNIDYAWAFNGSGLSSTSTFEAGKTYKLTVVATPAEGYTFGSSPNVKINGDSSTSSSNIYQRDLIVAYMEFTVSDTPMPTTISEINVTVTEPVDGAAPAAPTEATDNTTLSIYEWKHGGSNMADGEKFKSGETYRLQVIVYPASGCSFTASPSVQMNGKAATMYMNATNYVNYYYDFTVPESTTISTVNVTVTEPADGATPAEPVIITPHITRVSYRWDHGSTPMASGETFKAGETYRLYVDMIISDEGYTFLTSLPIVSGKINEHDAIRGGYWTNTLLLYYDFTVPESSTPTTYGIEITNGTAYYPLGTIVTAAAANTEVSITADTAPTGKVFDKWVVKEGGITVASETSETTTFTMPATAVKIEATYKDAPAGETPTMLEGNNGVFTKGSTTGLFFKSSGDFEEFVRVEIDGSEITETGNYTKASGSTDITLLPAYLETLAVSSHTIAIVSENGVANGNFTVQEAPGGNDEPTVVRYTVEHYKQTADGYVLADTETLTGNEGDTATATPKNYSGFTYDAGNANEVKSGTLTATAMLTLKLYYNLDNGDVNPGGDEDEKYDITVISGKATIGAGTIVTESEAGVTITITADAPASGKVFDKWVIKSDTQPVLAKATDATTAFTMPEGAVTVEATYKDAPVTLGDDEPTDPGEQNPETGAPVDPAPQTGDNSNLFLWIALLFVSSMGVIATTILGKKKKYNR